MLHMQHSADLRTVAPLPRTTRAQSSGMSSSVYRKYRAIRLLQGTYSQRVAQALETDKGCLHMEKGPGERDGEDTRADLDKTSEKRIRALTAIPTTGNGETRLG
jgi:hypothetical protein